MTLVKLDWHESVAVISLNRPDAANAISLDLAAALEHVAADIARSGKARAVVLRAEGKMFSGGGDVGAMLAKKAEGDTEAYAAFFQALVLGFHEAIRALRAIEAPLIAAVNGTAAGGGMSLALACDLVLVSPRAKFVPAYPGIGLSTDGGMSWSLPRLVGPKKAIQLLIDNRPIGADEAERLGLVSAILPEDAFDAAVLERAQAIAQMPRKALRAIRDLIDQGNGHSLGQQLDLELLTIGRLAVAGDAFEGIDAFAARRKPVFAD